MAFEIARFQAVRARTEALAAPLSAEDQVIQSMPDASPTKWHRAHTTWFFEEFVLHRWVPDYQPIDPRYRFLFNSYYEAVGERQPRPQRGMITRPSVSEVAEYRKQIDGRIAQLLDNVTDDADLDATMELGINHEQQHQELLLMDIKNALNANPFHPAYAEQTHQPHSTVGTVRWLEQLGGTVEIGHDGHGFAFDNEGPRHKVFLEPFALADRLVTNGDWLDFMADDAYRDAALWLSDGWAHINANRWHAPQYWHRLDGDWQVFTLHGLQPVDRAAPVVHVSYYEADAYARWAGARLPLEAEWERSAGAAPDTTFALEPRPVELGDHMDPEQWFGEVWQWTASPYSAYPRFSPVAGAVGEYNGKFMVDQQVLRGSACITPTGHARRTYRNFYPARARWSYSGVRLARDV